MTRSTNEQTTRAPLRVLCADDAPDIRESVRRALVHQPNIELVASIDTADALIETAKRCSPQVALVDLWMPGMDPLVAIEELCREMPTVAVLVYSGYDDQNSIDRALRAGARGLVSKDAGSADLIAAIERAARDHAGLA